MKWLEIFIFFCLYIIRNPLHALFSSLSRLVCRLSCFYNLINMLTSFRVSTLCWNRVVISASFSQSVEHSVMQKQLEEKAPSGHYVCNKDVSLWTLSTKGILSGGFEASLEAQEEFFVTFLCSNFFLIFYVKLKIERTNEPLFSSNKN